ncbi:MAG TPA: 50S ribosomal protein L14 [Candidatus Margulisiibacteriota bacterium]|nr:50S ribosomal protein L14 [Candidatus Margulisiibacteriota bacterium]
MLQLRSILDVADNTGAKKASFIGILNKKGSPIGSIGDVINVNIKESSPDAAIKKGEKARAVIVRTKSAIRRPDGSLLRFDRNAIVFIDAQSNPRGTRVFGPVARELREKNFTKIISLAPEVI